MVKGLVDKGTQISMYLDKQKPQVSLKYIVYTYLDAVIDEIFDEHVN